MIDYIWRPIEDLPEDWRELSHPDVMYLAETWQEQAGKIKKSEALTQFNDRLRRQWAIETGIIEGLYTIDRGTTLLLVERGIESSLIPHGSTDKPVETVVAILKDQESVLDGLMDFVRSRRELSKSYIKELHQTLTAHQETVEALDQFNHLTTMQLRRGEWKMLPNNPKSLADGGMHEYCPPVHVEAEMDRLIAMHLHHRELGVSPEVEAAWLHHRFTQIHPFQDGNGRVARALAALVLLRAQWFPLVIDRDQRVEYLNALEEADHGDLAPLAGIFSRLTKRAFIRALSISEDVLTSRASLEQLMNSAAARLRDKFQAQEPEKYHVFEISATLEGFTLKTVAEFGDSLQRTLKSIDSRFFTETEKNSPENLMYYALPVLNISEKIDYFADIFRYQSWVRLMIQEQRLTGIVFSFHPIGREFLGVMGISAFLELRYRDVNESGDGLGRIQDPIPVCSEVFEFSYKECEQSVLARYEAWLDNVLLTAVAEWRRQL